MINKIFPRQLNESADARVRKPTDMVDALNVSVTTDFDSDDSSGGDVGVLKPIKGNKDVQPRNSVDEFAVGDVTFTDIESGESVPFGIVGGGILQAEQRVLGSVTDDVLGIIFFFVWSSVLDEMGVYAYDRDGILPQSTPDSYVKVLSSRYFNFDSTGFVKGDVVHLGRPSFGYDKSVLLYFTDNVNEPRKIEVFRAMSETFDEYTEEDFNDLICACPRTPLPPITFYFASNASRSVSNFTKVPGMKFAYQHIYKDNTESAISTYSLLAIPPTYTSSGTDIPSVIPENVCVLQVPENQGDYVNRTKEIKSIRLLVQFGKTGVFKIIDEVSLEEANQYEFFNDRVLIPVTTDEQNKLFNNLPRRAQAQAIASDRLIYANYLDGYDDVDTSGVNVFASYKELPNTTLDVNISLDPFIIQSKSHNVPFAFGRNRISGYRIIATGFPDNLTVDSIVNLQFDVRPDQNFHVYDQLKSFHGSAQTAAFFNVQEEDSGGVNLDNPDNVDYREGRAYFGANYGVTSSAGNTIDNLRWKYYNLDGTEGSVKVSFGTSAANPLILKRPQGDLDFSVSFKIDQEVEQGGNTFIENTLATILGGGTVEGVTVLTNQSVSTDGIDCGLEGDFDSIQVSSGNDERKDLIVGVANIDLAPDNPGSDNPPNIAGGDVLDYAPCGYFIVNRARVSVGFKNFSGSGNIHTEGIGNLQLTSNALIGLDIKNITGINDDEPIDIRTCIPYFRREGASGKTLTGAYSDNSNTSMEVSPVAIVPLDEIHVDADIGSIDNIAGGTSYNDFLSLSQGPQNAGNAIFENLTIHSWRTYSRSYMATTDHNDWRLTPFSGNVTGSSLNTQEQSIQYICGLSRFENVLWYTQDQVPEKFTFQYIGNNGPGSQGIYIRVYEYTYAGGDRWLTKNTPNRLKVGGYLTDDTGSYNNNLKILATSEEREAYVSGFDGVDVNLLSCFSILDGEGIFQGTNNYYPEAPRYGSISGNVVWAGHIRAWMCHREFNYSKFTAGPGSNLLNESNPIQGIGADGQDIANCSYNEKRIFQSPLLRFLLHDEINDLIGPNLFPPGASEFVGDPNGTVNTQNEFNQFPNATTAAMSYAALPGTLPDTPGPFSFLPILNPESLQFIYDGTLTGQDETFVEIGTVFSSAFQSGSPASFRSFKTKANHEFGIVYYDERGRSGNVNYLSNLYVGGYNTQERGTNKGRVEVEIELNHNPPEWAKQYQIVYAGNTTYEDFIQYSTGAAFVDTQGATAEDFEATGGVIFVSLAYLQGANGLSYTDAYGAVSEEGAKDLYTFSPGDKLRVISYKDPSQNNITIYPKDYEFDVIGLKSFNLDSDNPFYDNLSPGDGETGEQNSPVHPSKEGIFIVLKNTSDATGFTYDDVLSAHEDGNVDGTTDKHFWNNNTIVEIFTPKKSADAEDRVYYEIGESYNVVEEDGELVHETNPVTVQRGDVFWRRVPVNLAEYNDESNVYENLFKFEGQVPRFKNVFLETSTFSDLFPFTDVNDFGKPKIILPNAGELNRRASLTYSDKNDYNGRFNRFSSFNNSVFNFKDIPNEYGAINYILNNYDSVFVIQENKCSVLPVSRDIIATASGVESLTVSNKVLGTQKYYAGDYGCDNNPESVTRVGTNIYFANKSSREVYRFNPSKGIEVISEAGMKKFFRNLFRDVIKEAIDEDKKVRVVGGYDPLNDEYILSVYAIEDGVVQTDLGEGTTTDEEVSAGTSIDSIVADLEQELEDQEDFYENQIAILNEQIEELQNQPTGAFVLTPKKYDQIVNAGGNELDNLLGDSSFSERVRLDVDDDNAVGVQDLLTLLTIYGSIFDNDNATEPQLPIDTDEQGNIIIG